MAIDFEALKLKLREERTTREKPFPVWALLILYENAPRNLLYINHFENFKLLVRWLSPISIPPEIKPKPIPKLYRSYEMQELARILNTTQENLNHAYITARQANGH